MNTTAPVIEDIKVKEASVKLSADMKLAGVPVTIVGMYNIHSNCYYPQGVTLAMPMPDAEGDLVNDFDLETFCEMMGWDHMDTEQAIQEAVERRDQ